MDASGDSSERERGEAKGEGPPVRIRQAARSGGLSGDQRVELGQDLVLDLVVEVAIDSVEQREVLVAAGLFLGGVGKEQSFRPFDDLAARNPQGSVEGHRGHGLDAGGIGVAHRPDLHFGEGDGLVEGRSGGRGGGRVASHGVFPDCCSRE